jgi:hypothetical protein
MSQHLKLLQTRKEVIGDNLLSTLPFLVVHLFLTSLFPSYILAAVLFLLISPTAKYPNALACEQFSG